MDILDYDPLTGEKVTFEWHETEGTFTIGHHQDVTNVLEENKRLVLEADHQKQVKDGWLKYASVPTIVIMKWKQEHGVDFFNENHWPKVMGLLNSPEYRFLKATPITHDR